MDASVAVEYLLKTELGCLVATLLDESELLAPSLIDAEILAVLRRAVRKGILSKLRAEEALFDLSKWPVQRVPLKGLTPLAWEFIENVSAYDAFYVAVAKLSGATLFTADTPLAKAPKPGVSVKSFRISE